MKKAFVILLFLTFCLSLPSSPLFSMGSYDIEGERTAMPALAPPHIVDGPAEAEEENLRQAVLATECMHERLELVRGYWKKGMRQKTIDSLIAFLDPSLVTDDLRRPMTDLPKDDPSSPHARRALVAP